MRRWQKTGSTLLTLIVGLVVGGLFSEVGTRLLAPQYDPRGELYFVTQPNGMLLAPTGFVGRQWKNTGDYNVAVTINRYGFRDSKDLATATADDIFVVGDSFSFGHGVEEHARYSNVLEHLSGLRVFNISIPGDFDNYRQLVQYAERQGARIRNLIVGVCMENDLRAYDTAIPASRGLGWRVKHLLTFHSALYRFVTATVHQTPTLRHLAMRLGLMASYTLDKHGYYDAVIQQSVARLLSVVQDYQPVILVIPSRALHEPGNAELVEDEWRTHREFVSQLRAHHVPVVDMVEQFSASDHAQYYFQTDGHWNVLGHAEAGAALWRYIEQAQPFGGLDR
jgi:hypothetical protein